MKIGILGTGMVGRAHAAALFAMGHDVMIGTRDVRKKLADPNPDAMGNPPFGDWHGQNSGVKVGPFADSAVHGEIVINAVNGEAALGVLVTLERQLTGKVLIDITNPLDFSMGMPPSLFVGNTDSLAEQIQKALPAAKVVKTFNTMNALLQVDPAQLSGGDHHIFLSGNDHEAKAAVSAILKSYGWNHIIDLGDITTARGAEMLMPLWLRLWGALKTPKFNFKIVTQ